MFCTLISLSFLAEGQVYKCTNKEGKKDYQSSPCSSEVKQDLVKTNSPEPQATDSKTITNKPNSTDILISEAKKSDNYFENKIRETTELYDSKIADLKKQNLTTESVETEKKLALREILIESAKAKEKNISSFENEEKTLQNEGKSLERDREKIEKDYAEFKRKLDNIGR